MVELPEVYHFCRDFEQLNQPFHRSLVVPFLGDVQDLHGAILCFTDLRTPLFEVRKRVLKKLPG